MSYIEMEHVKKEFKVYRRPDGVRDAVRSLFHREYEWKCAVQDVSISIEKGELVGYIGRNGAGKSTTIKMLSGILTPSAGRIVTDGRIPWENRKENARNIGVVFGQRTQLNWDLPMADSFQLYRRMYRIPDEEFRRNVELFTELLGLGEFLQKPVRQLSLGQKMRAEIAVSLLHSPGILYLDEPTIGLDVVVKEKIRRFVRELNRERRTTVILTTHDMKDIEEICSRIVMIDRGCIVLDLPMKEFRRREAGYYQIEVSFRAMRRELVLEGVECVRMEPGRRVYRADHERVSVNALLGQLADAFDVTDLEMKEPEIDEIVRKLYQKSERADTDESVGRGTGGG